MHQTKRSLQSRPQEIVQTHTEAMAAKSQSHWNSDDEVRFHARWLNERRKADNLPEHYLLGKFGRRKTDSVGN